jgi:RNA polymerase sigma-70 factor (ECF subfamily)
VWIRRARAGDGDALGRLLETYRAYLRLAAQLQIGERLGAKVDASDVVQETFLQAHRAFGRFRGETERELCRWLNRILASRISKQVRHYYGTEQRDVRIERALDAVLERSSQACAALLDAQGSPSAAAVGREEAVVLADALERLSEDHRRVIVLRHLQELTFPEVAERMGRTVGSVEKLWMRALGNLRGVLVRGDGARSD